MAQSVLNSTFDYFDGTALTLRPAVSYPDYGSCYRRLNLELDNTKQVCCQPSHMT